MHVEEDQEQKAARAPAWCEPPSTEPDEVAPSQRDLDDPEIEQGADRSGIPLRRRKLFGQPLATGGPTSDASSASSFTDDDEEA